MAAKSMGTKITGLESLKPQRQHRQDIQQQQPAHGKAGTDDIPLMRQSHSTVMTAGSSIHTEMTNSTPMRLTSSWRGWSAGG